MTVERLLAEVSSRELTEWMAYSVLEPFGEVRGDVRAGIMTAALVNLHRGKDDEPVKPTDFMPKYEQSAYGPEELAKLFGRETEDEDPALARAALSEKILAIFGQFKGAERKANGHH